MSRRRIRTAATLLVLALAVVASAEDVVVLTSGREIRGTVLEETDDAVRVGISGGSVWFPRDRVQEIRRGADKRTVASVGGHRTTHALLYADGVRVGTRTLRYTPQGDGHQWEEHVVFLGEDGLPELEVRTLERAGAKFEPVLFQVRESPRDGAPRLLRGEVLGTLLQIDETVRGEVTRTIRDLRDGARLPFAARDEFVQSKQPTHEVAVFDVRDRRWRDVVYTLAGERTVEDADGDAVTVKVLHRRRGEAREIEWVAPDGRALLADLNGADLRALAAPKEAVRAVAEGQPDRVFGPDSAARTRYEDPALGFAIRKPDPSWIFEPPVAARGGALLSVRNAALGAAVDVLRDPSPPEGVTLERAGAALERVLRAHAPDLAVDRRETIESDGATWFELEALATTKGERTRTLARVIVSGDRVYRLLAACPEGRFELLRADLVMILDSFETR